MRGIPDNLSFLFLDIELLRRNHQASYQLVKVMVVSIISIDFVENVPAGFDLYRRFLDHFCEPIHLVVPLKRLDCVLITACQDSRALTSLLQRPW